MRRSLIAVLLASGAVSCEGSTTAASPTPTNPDLLSVPVVTRVPLPSAPPPTATPSPTPTTQSSVQTITVNVTFFDPKEVTVAVGTKVVWVTVGSGEQTHDVVAVDGSFRSASPITPGAMFSYTFEKPGEYPYVCSFHIREGMTGKIVVK